MNRLTFQPQKDKFLIRNFKGDILGIIYFDFIWKKFVSEHYAGFKFDSNCHREIADECDRLTEEKFK